MVSSTTSDSLPRVLGVLIARNEWPLLGISITHALVNHVDEIIVVDHASTDETQDGLAALQKRWGSKIQVLNLGDGIFHHEETNLILKSMYQDRDFDWVYPIDADEFLITPNNQSLKELLADVPGEYAAVRYQLHNFVAPSNFEESDFSRYVEIDQKAVTNPSFELTHANIFESVIAGGLNFFDVPFASKILFRPTNDKWAIAGSHLFLGIHSEKEFGFPEDAIFVAHLPFLTQPRLSLRAQQGKGMVKAGYSRDHGWQSQVVYQMEIEGRLEEYWNSNSVSSSSGASKLKLPKTITDKRLSAVLVVAVAELRSTLDLIYENSRGQQSNGESTLTLSQGVRALRAMALHKQEGIDSAHLHIKNLDNHIKSLQSQLQVQAEHHAAEQSALLNSISWRTTKFLRIGHQMFIKKFFFKSSKSKPKVANS